MIYTLEADGIRLSFEGRNILSDIYIKATTGKITGLLGRNGEGKSCLLNIICGNLEAERSIRINSKSYPQLFKRNDLLRYLPQFNFIPKSLSLKRIFKDFNIEQDLFRQSFPEFTAPFTSSARHLSGGELRLLELYVIVKSSCRFVLLDEPFTHLNPQQLEKVKDWFRTEKSNKGMIITDHMYRHVMSVCDSLYVLANGKTHLTKSAEDIERLGYARL